MMGDFEQVGIESSAAVQDLAFDAALNVAGQQEAALTKLKTESQRIIVSRSVALSEIRGRDSGIQAQPSGRSR